tara:strand:+ start:351 stop:824 length:474 start_codon:yes stop_codon:yes gene_type:complete
MCYCERGGKFSLNRDFCSRYCFETKGEETEDPIEVNCYWCGNSITLKRTQGTNNLLYCGRECQNASNRGRKSKGGGGNKRMRLSIIQHLRHNMDKKLSAEQVRYDLEQNYRRSFRKNSVAAQLTYLVKKSIVKKQFGERAGLYYMVDKDTPIKTLLC